MTVSVAELVEAGTCRDMLEATDMFPLESLTDFAPDGDHNCQAAPPPGWWHDT